MRRRRRDVTQISFERVVVVVRYLFLSDRTFHLTELSVWQLAAWVSKALPIAVRNTRAKRSGQDFSKGDRVGTAGSVKTFAYQETYRHEHNIG